MPDISNASGNTRPVERQLPKQQHCNNQASPHERHFSLNEEMPCVGNEGLLDMPRI